VAVVGSRDHYAVPSGAVLLEHDRIIAHTGKQNHQDGNEQSGVTIHQRYRQHQNYHSLHGYREIAC
jgi:hypothetical protein